MDENPLIKLIDGLASDFLFLDDRTIDVPTAGCLLNHLEAITDEADKSEVPSLKTISVGLAALLENIILNGVADEESVFVSVNKGINAMQEIVSDLSMIETCPERDTSALMEEIARLAGDRYAHEPKKEDAIISVQKTEIRDESLLKDFIIEGLEYINEIEVNILNLERNPQDKDFVNAIFRPFHSIKGVAGFLNLENIRDLSHNLENLLDKVRKDELTASSDIIDVILDGADALKALIESLQKELEDNCDKISDVDTNIIVERIKSIETGQGRAAKVKKLGEILVDDGIITQEVLTEALETAQEPPPKKLGETLITAKIVTPKQVSQALRKQSNQINETTSIRVDTRKLDDLIDMVGELVITQSMIRQNPALKSSDDKKLLRDISQLSSITSELQRTSTSMRMIPIKQTFQRMARLVRDLSKTAGKTIDVVLTGEETEIDRNMVEEIYNPLVHLVRNAADHGIETPRERIEVGKPSEGTIHLKAYHRGGTIVIEISDDGKGLDKRKILETAIKNGLIDANSNIAEQDIFRLIFMPGLSTANKVTDVSGRGVGMDVVKKAIDRLRGKIDIQSNQGKGTTFIASFPLTLAIIDGMIVKIGKEKYILPTNAVRQLLRPDQDMCSTVAEKAEMINVRGKLLPMVRLHELFDVRSEKKMPWESIVMVIESDSRSKCFMVDEILGKEEVVIKGLGTGMKKTKGISGGAILGDGNIGLILDPEGLFDLSEAVGA